MGHVSGRTSQEDRAAGIEDSGFTQGEEKGRPLKWHRQLDSQGPAAHVQEEGTLEGHRRQACFPSAHIPSTMCTRATCNLWAVEMLGPIKAVLKLYSRAHQIGTRAKSLKFNKDRKSNEHSLPRWRINFTVSFFNFTNFE